MKIIDEWMGRDLKPELPFHKSSLFAKWPKMMKCTNFSGKFQIRKLRIGKVFIEQAYATDDNSFSSNISATLTTTAPFSVADFVNFMHRDRSIQIERACLRLVHTDRIKRSSIGQFLYTCQTWSVRKFSILLPRHMRLTQAKTSHQISPTIY